VASRIIN